MKKVIPFLPLLLVLLTACPKKDDTIDQGSKATPLVSRFVYDGLSTFYLWANTITKEPTSADENDPKKYFKSLLYPIDTTHGWSWITDDVDALLADFSGSPKDFGWSLALYAFQDNSVEGYVKYVFPNTPAANAGIKRGDVIFSCDGGDININNYTTLFDGNSHDIGVGDPVTKVTRSVRLTPVIIQTNPVLKDTVYKNDARFAGKKIGYLFYTDFISNFNNKLYEACTKFKAEGVTDLVIDLRYNHGGHGQAAAYLASLIAPRNVVESRSVFTILNYNDFINSTFDKEGDGRKTYFINSGDQNPLNVNLNLNKVYIIATDDSYSASELLTFCLKPYMDVVHIGSNTGGKFTGSFTMHAYNDYDGEVVALYDEGDLTAQEKNKLKNWAMQPIVAKYSDKNNNDFVNPGYLAPAYPMNVDDVEEDPSIWKPIGDVNDYMLAKAVSLITGLPVQASAQANTIKRSVHSMKRISNPADRLKETIRFTAPAKKGFGKELLLKIRQEQLSRGF